MTVKSLEELSAEKFLLATPLRPLVLVGHRTNQAVVSPALCAAGGLGRNRGIRSSPRATERTRSARLLGSLGIEWI